MKRTLAGIGIIALLLAGCATKTSSPPGNASEPSLTQPPNATPTPANPVPILQKIKGCVIEPGVVAGETDIYGNRYASCTFMDGKGLNDAGNETIGAAGAEVEVRTFPGDPRTAEPVDPYRSDDSTKYIIGNDFVVSVMIGASGFEVVKSRQTDPNTIAREVGGEFIPDK